MVSAVPDPSMTPAATAISKKGWDAWLSHAQSRGANPWYGRQLYHDVSINGIGDLQAEGIVTMSIGGTPSARFWKITLEQVQDQILEAGLLTLAELEDYRSLLESPEYRWFTGCRVLRVGTTYHGAIKGASPLTRPSKVAPRLLRVTLRRRASRPSWKNLLRNRTPRQARRLVPRIGELSSARSRLPDLKAKWARQWLVRQAYGRL
jgi:hypothetical protein